MRAEVTDRIPDAGGVSVTGWSIALLPISLASAIAILVACYWEGLSGPFILDDMHNLSGLPHLDGLTWQQLRDWLNTGTAGPTGRPLALLSFLINGEEWPLSAWAFKYTNVLLHAANFMLVLWLSVLLITRIQGGTERTLVLAGVAAALWAFSPYHASTTLYVVQRMAMLSAFWVLAGLILYFKARTHLENGRLKKSAVLLFMAYLSGLVLGGLSKENAALFVLLVPIMEWTIFGPGDPLPKTIRDRLRILIAIPMLLFIVVVAAKMPSWLEGYSEWRNFSPFERLLSEGRAVGYYIWRFVVPGTEYIGVYSDGFQKSTALFEPLSTLAWIAAHLTLICGAILLRRSYPLLAFGLLFFYAGHLMESTVLPLELLFEHRAYLPTAFLWVGVVMLPRGWILNAALILLVANMVLLKEEVKNWRDPHSFVTAQLERNPDSDRALQAAAGWHLDRGHHENAFFILSSRVKGKRFSVNNAFLLAASACRLGRLNPYLPMLHDAARQSKGVVLRSNFMRSLLQDIRFGYCKQIGFARVRDILGEYLQANADSPVAEQAYFRALMDVSRYEGDYLGYRSAALEFAARAQRVMLVLDVCQSLTVINPRDGCSCLKQGRQMSGEDGFRHSLVRAVSGYREQVENSYRRAMSSACVVEE